MRLQSAILLMVLVCVDWSLGNRVVPSCGPEATTCEFKLTASHKYTMMKYSESVTGGGTVLMVDKDGNITKRTGGPGGACPSEGVPISHEELADVIIGDGHHKLLSVYNKTLPGPPIVVYEGQEVVVRLSNDMMAEGTTIHWHGLHQKGTPWMDGMPWVTQCPIHPAETFTYRFKAEPVGTHWYHSHVPTQRTAGLYGPLIILPKDKEAENSYRGSDPLPDFDDDFYMVVSDLFPNTSIETLLITKQGTPTFANGYDSSPDQCHVPTMAVDGIATGVLPFHSAVINGKGRRYLSRGGELEHRVPLEVFMVKKGGKFRFRVIQAANTWSFRISVDHHRLQVVSSDGSDLVTKEAESVIVFTGERWDFWIDATDPMGTGNYWIRAETLEDKIIVKKVKPYSVQAILRYEGASETEPTHEREECTPKSPCHVINCPFKSFPKHYHMNCIPMTSLRSPARASVLPSEDKNFQEVFLNFDMSAGLEEYGKASNVVNGKYFTLPSEPLQFYEGDVTDITTPCVESTCTKEKLCSCTYSINIPTDTVVQMVFTHTTFNIGGNPHPIHLHGNHFQVLKQGYGVHNGFAYTQLNPDIKCVDKYCRESRWSNNSWTGGKVPAMVETSPPLKDTIILPFGGYVVVRFKANNPGYWFMHCHTDFHAEDSMALVLKIGDTSEMPAPPSGIPRCGNFEWSSEEYQQAISGTRAKLADKERKSKLQTHGMTKPSAHEMHEAHEAQEASSGPGVWPYITAVFAITSILLAVLSLQLYRRQQVDSKGEYMRLDSSEEG